MFLTVCLQLLVLALARVHTCRHPTIYLKKSLHERSVTEKRLGCDFPLSVPSLRYVSNQRSLFHLIERLIGNGLRAPTGGGWGVSARLCAVCQNDMIILISKLRTALFAWLKGMQSSCFCLLLRMKTFLCFSHLFLKLSNGLITTRRERAFLHGDDGDVVVSE